MVAVNSGASRKLVPSYVGVVCHLPCSWLSRSQWDDRLVGRCHPDPRVHWTVRGRGRYFECLDDRAGFEYRLRCPWRSDTVDRELFVSARRQAFQRWVVRLSATNRRWVSPFGGKSIQFGGKSVQGLFAAVHVDFIVFSSLFRVLFVLPVGLARLDVCPFSFGRLECSCHPSESTKGDLSICWAQGRCLSSAFRSVLLFFFAFWSLRRPAVWFFVAEGLFVLFWWIGVLFPPLPIENYDFWSL